MQIDVNGCDQFYLGDLTEIEISKFTRNGAYKSLPIKALHSLCSVSRLFARLGSDTSQEHMNFVNEFLRKLSHRVIKLSIRTSSEHSEAWSLRFDLEMSSFYAVNIRGAGSVGGQGFHARSGHKGPDSWFCDEASGQQTIVLEVAYHNKSRTALFFETGLWSQQEIASGRAFHSVTNFLGTQIEAAEFRLSRQLVAGTRNHTS